MGKCSHCGVIGHNYTRCPQLSPEQIKEIKEKKKKENEERVARRVQRQARVTGAQNQINPTINIELINMTDYEIACYYRGENGCMFRFMYAGAQEQTTFKCRKSTYIEMIPIIEVLINPNGIETHKFIHSNHEYTKVFAKVMGDFDGTTIIIDKKYKPPKSEVDQWKELGLKSHYLLTQIENMTSEKKDGEVIVNGKYEPIAALIDMVQDLVVPKQCTEADRERAGIPSILTNVT
jgi:hypothetical protein